MIQITSHRNITIFHFKQFTVELVLAVNTYTYIFRTIHLSFLSEKRSINLSEILGQRFNKLKWAKVYNYYSKKNFF